MIKTPGELRTRIVGHPKRGTAVATDDGTSVTVTASATTYTFSRADGRLTGVTARGRAFALRNGPTLSVRTATLQSFVAAQDGNDYMCSAEIVSRCL
jgi:hypothetical protein